MAVSGGILVLRALGLGDLLTGVPALRALRRAFDGERLVLAAPEGLRDIVELIDAVDELLPTAGLGELAWPGAPPRLAVNLHGRGPESIHDLLAQEPVELITHRHPDFPGVDGPDWPEDVHEVDRWCRLLEAARIPAERDALGLPPPPGPSPAPGAVVIHPGAAFAARRWPPERYAHVARELAGEHRVVVTGSAAEVPLAREVAEAAGLPEDAVLAGNTGLAELAATVAEAKLVICGDTGVGHLATAYGTPSVLLFGPTPPCRWGPPREARQHVVLWVGDVGDPHADRPDPGLLLLREDRVLTAAEGLLAERASHG
ncbi:glycosyltransferase family 9 protein [Amycolatopsis regifaucium]|uniref:Glycosyl transferase n=1 Tax=Amycolatopsis regifaucium TaxID=546365 RepID=A0A154M3Y6_9PSEU|nr:glycosyltransferase family 9 protein [Amycolatopsis regifaucium]KZB79334.1 glycosyl transferase [Amycolatopsis regifaucium]OKA07517.1 glycosyl transferase [Amycolatopsis regifaucium]SFH09511.1 ADP-heptose:LPS heptosyltransferase [Amycolatopsis regifaucium]